MADIIWRTDEESDEGGHTSFLCLLSGHRSVFETNEYLNITKQKNKREQ